jgi:hypothetical protein
MATVWRFACIVALAVGLTALLSAPARADTNGTRWPTTSVRVYDATGSTKVAAAVRAWNQATIMRLRLVKTPCTGCITITRGPTDDASWSAQNERSIAADGVTITACDVVIATWYKDAFSLFRTVVMHEVGHCIGLAHISDTTIPSVMQAVATVDYDRPTVYDAGEILKVYG